VFHRFGQAKFTDGGSILTFKPIFATIPAALKSEANYKSGQN
jgi:hypothetical protein